MCRCVQSRGAAAKRQSVPSEDVSPAEVTEAAAACYKEMSVRMCLSLAYCCVFCKDSAAMTIGLRRAAAEWGWRRQSDISRVGSPASRCVCVRIC